MNKEIEFKFLVKKSFFDSIKDTHSYSEIEQYYLITKPGFQVRIRIETSDGITKASLTTKTGKKPIRDEYEIEIPLDYAQVLAKNSLSLVKKRRYKINYKKSLFEIDYYPEKDIVVAEIELEDTSSNYDKPDWLLEEVTTTKEYSNTFLSQPIQK